MWKEMAFSFGIPLLFLKPVKISIVLNRLIYSFVRVGRDGRADEGAGLENQYGSNLIVGSNPTLSAVGGPERSIWRDARVAE